MPDRPPPPSAPLGESWGRLPLLGLAGLLLVGNFAWQLAWYDWRGGLFAPVLVGAVGGVLVPLLVLGWRFRWRPARDFALDRPAPVVATGSVLLALATLAPGSLLAWVSLRLHPVDPEWLANYTRNLPRSPQEIAVAVAAVVVVGPLVEELIFRGLLQRALRQTWGPWPAVTLSSLAFGLVHGEPWYLLGLVATGLLLGFIRETTGSLTCCWLAHAAYNAVSLGVLVAEGPAGAQPTAPTGVDLALAAGSLVMLLVTGRWLWLARRSRAD